MKTTNGFKPYLLRRSGRGVQDLLSVNLDTEGRTVKEIDSIQADNAKDMCFLKSVST